MKKPNIGDIVRVDAAGDVFTIGRVFELYDRVDEWWDTAQGENKVALLDALEEYGPEKAASAEWFAMIENVEYDGETMAVASFECEPA